MNADIKSLRHPFLKYCDEALGLGIFMFSAGIFDILIENPGFPIRQHLSSAFLRRFLVGLSMGLTALYIFNSRFGKTSGAYINPIVTLVRYYLGNINLKDSIFYCIFQFAGGSAGLFLVSILFPKKIAHPSVNYIVTVPGKDGAAIAFILEAIISFILIVVALFTERSLKLHRYTNWFVASLIVIFITLESPFSGMSMNPARTFASAVVAGQWNYFWLYCTAPVLGMASGLLLFMKLKSARNSNTIS